MEKLKRTLFFWFLVLVFCLITPVIVLQAKGYRFDWHRGVFVFSGTISFKSNPQTVSAELNGILNENKKLNRINSSFNVSGLLPDDYTLKILAPGYNTWEKKIDVHSGISSEFWNIVLTRTDYKKTNYPETTGIETFFTSPKNRFIAYTQDDNQNLLVKILDLNDSSIASTFSLPNWKLLSLEKKENIEWSPEESYLSIPVEKDGNETFYIADITLGTVTNLNDFFGKNEIRHVRWDPKSKGYFFFLEGQTLFRGNIADKNDLVVIASDAPTYELSYDSVFFVQLPNNLVFKTNLDGTVEKLQITSDFPGQADTPIDRMIVYDQSRIAFLDKNQNLFIYNDALRDKYFHQIGNHIVEMHFSNDGKKLLFWSNNEISVYFARDWDVQPIRKEDELSSITRYSDTLQNVGWYKDYEHIIFSVGKYTKIIELDPRDHRNCLDLITTTLETPQVIHNHGLEKIFYTDLENGTPVLNSFIFPEPVPILGIGGA
ncbi:MAG: hypothetical protein WA064_02630 [Candidatus Moraniibacteriota bacterium]